METTLKTCIDLDLIDKDKVQQQLACVINPAAVLAIVVQEHVVC